MREVMLILHFIGLAMGLGTGFAHAFLGSITTKMTQEEAMQFRLHSLVLGKMGHIGIVLLLISGFYLIMPYWKIIPSMPFLMAKLSLVAVLIFLIILISIASKKARTGNADVQLKKMEQLGKMTLLVGIAIVALSVKFFH